MNVLTNNMIYREVRTFAFPLKPFPYDNIVLAFFSLRPDSVSKIADLINLAMS
jgi:hypothetical protein